MRMSRENVAEGSIFAPSKSGNGVTIGSAVDAGYGGRHSRMGLAGKASTWPPRDLAV
jgi:hypothetical protein